MMRHFLLVGAVAVGWLIFASDVEAHGGGGGGGRGGGGRGGMYHGGAMFHGGGGMYHGGGYTRGFGSRGRYFNNGRFWGPGFGFYSYGYGYPGWDDGDYGYYSGPYYGDYEVYGGPPAGDQNPQVVSIRAVQVALAWRGYYRGRIDGVMGQETREAISAFQAHQSLPVTGQIDPALLNALRTGGAA
jgi:Putative peptidoglycan binding domain